jgi:threonine dehydrogenase-like Zn-dependent dehydrogenase
MKAVAVTPGHRDSLHLRDDVPEPDAGDNQALVRTLEVGVCGTDVEIHRGLFGAAPPGSPYLILGHENLGAVVSAPPGSMLAEGDLVVSTVRRPCPEMCHPCTADRNDMCLTGHYTERGIQRRHGFMSERYSESPSYLVRLPQRLRQCAVLLEPLSIVEKGIEQAFKVQERLPWDGSLAVVLGGGAVGLLAATALRLRGFETVVASLAPEGGPKDALLQEAGIRYVSVHSTPIEALPGKLGRIDLVFEATGSTSVVFPALQIVGRNGVCVLASVTGGHETVQADLAAWNRESVLGNRAVVGTVNAARRHFEAGVRDMETAENRRPGWLARLVTRRVPYTEAGEAMQRTPDVDVKTVVEFS